MDYLSFNFIRDKVRSRFNSFGAPGKDPGRGYVEPAGEEASDDQRINRVTGEAIMEKRRSSKVLAPAAAAAADGLLGFLALGRE